MKRTKPSATFDLAVILFSGALIGILFSFGGFNLPQLPFQLPFSNPAVSAAIQSQDSFVFDFVNISTSNASGRAVRITAPQGVTFSVPDTVFGRNVSVRTRTVYFLSLSSSDLIQLWFKDNFGVWRQSRVDVPFVSALDANNNFLTLSGTFLNVSILRPSQINGGLMIIRDARGRLVTRAPNALYTHGGVGVNWEVGLGTYTVPYYRNDVFRWNHTKTGYLHESWIVGFRAPHVGEAEFMPNQQDYSTIVHYIANVKRALPDEPDLEREINVTAGFTAPSGAVLRTASPTRIVIVPPNVRG